MWDATWEPRVEQAGERGKLIRREKASRPKFNTILDPRKDKQERRSPEPDDWEWGAGRHRAARAKAREWQEAGNLEVDTRSGGASAEPKCPLAGGGGRAGQGRPLR